MPTKTLFKQCRILEKLIFDKAALASGVARKALRWFLFERAGDNTHEGSVGDALALLARAQSKISLAAIVTLRAIGLSGLMPDENATNQIARLVSNFAKGLYQTLSNF